MNTAMLIHIFGLVLIAVGTSLHYVPGAENIGTALVGLGVTVAGATVNEASTTK